jgi:hypothetical protein
MKESAVECIRGTKDLRWTLGIAGRKRKLENINLRQKFWSVFWWLRQERLLYVN